MVTLSVLALVPSVAVACVDSDNDGYGVHPETSVLYGCPSNGIDCDDTNPDVHPFQDEVCGDSIDNNCRHGNDEGCGPAPAFDGWRVMPVRSEGEFQRGAPGGRAEQWLQGAARCRADPDVIYLSHDCSQIWRSRDGGASWEKPLNVGLSLPMAQSIEVDPVDCERVVLILDNAYDWRHTDFPGIYRSEDGGDHWQFVQAGPTFQNRRYEHNVAWAPSSSDSHGARLWYAALYNEPDEPRHDEAGIRRSTDYGETWSMGASLADHFPVYEVQVSPADAETILVASNLGLHRSVDGGVSLAAAGDLPAGEVTSVAFDPADAEIVYAVVRGSSTDGLYRSVNGGDSFARVTVADNLHQSVLDDARRVFIHPVHGDIFYVLPQSSTDGRTAIRTDSGGMAFATTSMSLEADVAAWRWGINISGDFAFVLPSAVDDTQVVAQSGGAALYRSTDGLIFENGSTLYTGANCGLANFSIAFDPREPARFATGNADIGMYLTENGGDWFEDRAIPWAWVHVEVPWGSQYTIDFHPSQDGRMVGIAGYVFSKRLVQTANYGRDWELVDDDVGHYWRVAYHPLAPNVVYAGHQRSLDGGATFSDLPIPAELDDADVQVMDYCRAQPDIVYTASRSTHRILRSNDRGDTWELYASPAWALDPFDPIMTFAVDPADCDQIYTVDSSGDLVRFDGSTWESLGVLAHVNPPDGYYVFVRAVMVDPNHPEIIYAGIFGSGVSSIFRSIDSGVTWEDISYNRFRDSVSGINVSPHSGEVMVSGCSGTWVLPPPYDTNFDIYDRLYPRPSCYDGLQNGSEEGVDCGGDCDVICDCEDRDSDSHPAGQACSGVEDCDDEDPEIYPGATERCNHEDDNCDGNIDEGCEDGGGAGGDAGGGDSAPESGGDSDAPTSMVGGCNCRFGAGNSWGFWVALCMLPRCGRRRQRPHG